MFERAFLPVAVPNRPSAAEWFTALGGVEFQKCHWGHIYYRRLSACPWCAIWQSGGANFFFVATAVLPPGASSSEIERVLREVVALVCVNVSVPARQALSLPAASGSPFPVHIEATRGGFYGGWLLLVAAVIGLCAAPPALIVWLICGAFGLSLVAQGLENPKYVAQIKARREAAKAAESSLEKAIRESGLAAETYRRTFEKEKEQAVRTLQMILTSERGLPASKQALTEKHRRDFQLNEFLDRRRVTGATIPGMARNARPLSLRMESRPRSMRSALTTFLVLARSDVGTPRLGSAMRARIPIRSFGPVIGGTTGD